MKMQDSAFRKRNSDLELTYKKLAELAAFYGTQKLVLYGSRARGDNRRSSDIDIAVYGMPESKQTAFREKAEELPTLLEFDIVFMRDGLNPAFVENVEKDGVNLMNKFQEKYGSFAEAVERLKEALKDYQTAPLTSVRDGAIQRFEFCTELAWKTMREYLLDEGFADLNSPKAVLKKAYAFGLIEDEAGWCGMVNDRNMTGHVYNEQTAVEIFERIENRYLVLFEEVLKRLSE